MKITIKMIKSKVSARIRNIADSPIMNCAKGRIIWEIKYAPNPIVNVSVFIWERRLFLRAKLNNHTIVNNEGITIIG